MRKLTVIKPDGTITPIIVHARGSTPLHMLQELVDGLIESVPHFNRYEGQPCGAYVNEEGVLKGLPFNEKATKLWLELLGDGPFSYKPELFGTLVIDQLHKPENDK